MSTAVAPAAGRRAGWSAPGVPQLVYFGTFLVLAYLVIPPLLILIQTSFWVPTGLLSGYYSPENLFILLRDPALAGLLTNTFIFAIGSTTVALALGGLFAWLVERTNVPFKNVAYAAAFIGLALPGVIRAIGWGLLLGPRNGLLTLLAMDVFHLEKPPFDIYSWPGLIMVEGLFWAPAVFLLLAIPFHSMDASLEEAAVMSGASTWQVFRRITLGVARPAVLSVLVLTFARTLQAFDNPAIIGTPAGIQVLVSAIYYRIRTGISPDYGSASAFGLLLIVFLGIAIYFYSAATRNAQRFATISGKGFRPREMDLGKARVIGALVILILPLSLVLPFAALVWTSLLPTFERPSLDALSHMTFLNYVEAFTLNDVRQAMTNTLIVGVASATGAVALAAVAAWLIYRTKLTGRVILDYLISVPLIVPGIVMGLAILRTYLTVPIPIYGTVWILVIANLTVGLPFAARYAYPGVIQIHRELEESAQLSGAGWLRVVGRILLPLMVPALFGAWIWSFLSATRELSMVVLLAGPTSQVVSSIIYQMWSDGRFATLTAFSIGACGFFAAIALVIRVGSRRWGLQA